MNETLFTRHCAIWFITRPLVKNKPWLFISLYFLSVLLVGSCMSTTVIVLIYLNINEEIFKVLNLQKGYTLAAMITMGLVITAGISGAMTPIAHVFPLVSINFYTSLTGTSISYLSYIIAGVPTALVAVSCMLLIFRFVLKPNVEPLAHIDLGVLTNSLKPADRREKLAVFALVVLLWVVPDLIKYLFLPIMDWIAHYGTVMPPLLGTVLFCIIQVDGKPLLKLEDCAKNIPWTSLFMAAAALALGSAITNKDIGLSTFIESLLVPLSSFSSEFIIVFLLVLITAFMTNICSNMVTVTIIRSFALQLAIAMNGVLHVGALAVIIGMVSAYAFATPPAMTTVVLGTGTGWINNKQMSKYEFLVLIPSILAIAFISYPIAKSFI
ncbi:SLC13 family permease [Eubacterium aggregans]|uniref:SLC13 family permease n=1 Tax=Eubacterium aggregans TaxID=81409 RepID=UPI003F3A9808